MDQIQEGGIDAAHVAGTEVAQHVIDLGQSVGE